MEDANSIICTEETQEEHHRNLAEVSDIFVSLVAFFSEVGMPRLLECL
jgi:hypothetical protein